MALSAFFDAFNIGTGAAGSTVVRTGYGFQPKACIYFWSGRTEATSATGLLDNKLGGGGGVSSTDRRCVTTQDQTGAGTMVTDKRHDNAACIATLTNTGTLDGLADLQTFDSDGQTLVIDDQFTTSVRVQGLALGGGDLAQAATFQFQAPLVTGTQDITTLGFQPDALLLLSIGYQFAPPAMTGGNLMSLGVVGGGTQAVVGMWDADATVASVCARYHTATECLALHDSVTSINMRAAWTAMLSTGFRLNWSEVGSATQPYILGIALRGGSYKVGQVTTQIDTTTPIVVSSLGFQ